MGIRRDPDPTRLLPILSDRLGRLSLRSAQILLVLLLAAVTVWGLLRLSGLVVPVVFATILAAAFAPLVVLLRRRGAPRALAASVALIGVLLAVAAVFLLVIYGSAGQWKAVVDAASGGFSQIQKFLAGANLPIDQSQLAHARDSIVSYLTSAQFGSTALGGLSFVSSLVTSVFLLLVALFFFLKDGDAIWDFLLRPASDAGKARGRRIGPTAVRVLGGYVRGTTIIALSVAVPIGAALFLLRVPLALPLTVVVFLASYIPIVGGVVSGAIAVLVALVADGTGVALILLVVVVVVNQLAGTFVGPLVMSQSLELHPLVIVLTLTAGGILGGIIGAALAVPITAVAWEIVKVWDDPNDDPEPHEKATSGAPSGA